MLLVQFVEEAGGGDPVRLSHLCPDVLVFKPGHGDDG